MQISRQVLERRSEQMWKNLYKNVIIIYFLSLAYFNFSNCNFISSKSFSKKISCAGEFLYIESICDDERELLNWAINYKPNLKFQDLNTGSLFKIMKEEGIDKATAVFYHRAIQENTFIFEYLKKKELSLQVNVPNYKSKDITLLVIPGMFYQIHETIDSTAKEIRGLASKLGISSSIIKTQQSETIQFNGQIICNYLYAEKSSRIIILSASKGSTDFLESIKICGEHKSYKKIIGWINIGGINKGTLIVDSIQRNLFNYLQARFYFFYYGLNWNGLLSISYNPEYFSKINIPNNIKIINIVGVPVDTMITERARPYYQILSDLGPNEGMNLLGDSYLKNSITIPLWRNDHYFQSPISSIRVLALLSYLVEITTHL